MSSSIVSSTVEGVVSAGHRNVLVDRAMRAGRPVVGVTCSLVPVQLLSLGGMVPIRLRSVDVVGTPMADTYLSSVCCTYPRALLEEALSGTMDDLSGYVFATSCDHLRRLHDNVAYLLEPAFNHIVDIPHKADRAGVDWYADELRELATRLGEHFNVEVSRDALVDAMEHHNEMCAALRELGDLRKLDQPPLSGGEHHRLMLAAQIAPREAIVPELEGALDRARRVTKRGETRPWRARLMVVGSQIDDPRFIDAIEGVGGLVVADRVCTGSLPGLEPIRVGPVRAGADPYLCLAEHSLRRARHCPRMMDDFPYRLEEVLTLIEEYGVHGVVVVAMKFCDLWGFESSALASALRDRGVPVLRLEREYAFSGEGQLRTRVQAFLESMGR